MVMNERLDVRDNCIQIIQAELETASQLAKCQKCGCMRQTLDSLASALPTVDVREARALAQDVETWARQLQPVEYACLGCQHCHPAAAQNALDLAFPVVDQLPLVGCGFHSSGERWPVVAGEYYALDEDASVAVSTLASVQLAEDLATRKPRGLAIVGKTETENIGIDKVVKNVISNPSIRYLIVAGEDPVGHLSGKTLLALAEHGIDSHGRVAGSSGRRPVLRNVSPDEVQAFRERVQVVDMLGCLSADEISARVVDLSHEVAVACGCAACCQRPAPTSTARAPSVLATEPTREAKLDKAGYFVFIPLADRKVIVVEHYAYDHRLLRVIEGASVRAIYSTIIANGWVTELSHAAYVGKELAKAELSMAYGFRYVQDGA